MEAPPLADLLQALADPTRLRILSLLRRMELSVGELAIILDQSQPRVSRHVRILADAGIVERRREGSWVFLTIAPEERTEPMFARWSTMTSTGQSSAFIASVGLNGPTLEFPFEPVLKPAVPVKGAVWFTEVKTAA